VEASSVPPRSGVADDRLQESGLLRKALNRPELGAVAGAIAIWIFFAVYAGSDGFLTKLGTANYLVVAALLGILAVAVSMLMIGGEFDLSIGSIIGATGMVTALLYDRQGWNLWLCILASLVVALVIGFLNGLIVVKTGLPSFIVTLGSSFVLAGTTIGYTRHLTGRTQIGGLQDAPGYDAAHKIFASDYQGFQIAILWWLAITALATWVLLRRRFGNWTFGAGGNADAARNVGVPVARVKILLFMTTATASWLVATIEVVQFTGADVLRGQGKEFEAIIAAVIGGTLLTGGYGSAFGAAVGALIFGMVNQGIVFAGIDSDWYKAFLGAMLIIAVLVNTYIRKKAAEAR
jgi:simple sugar transport system permease protein